MLSWCKTRRAAVLFGIAGVLVVALFVHWIAPAAGQAVKKAAKPLSIPHPVKPEAVQPPAPAVPPPLPPYTPPPTTGVALPPAIANPPAPPVPPATDFTSKSIDQLLNDLDAVRAKKGEMDTQEKKLIAVLRQKLADQEQRLRKHGLMPVEEPAQVPVPVSTPTSSAH
jgi:hypothetical protein